MCNLRHLTTYTGSLIIIVLAQFGASYMVKGLSKGDITHSVVRLTKRGYEETYLRHIARQRPIPVKEPKAVIINNETFYELEFDCSHIQIMNYFFSFGADAIIVSPKEVRDKLIEKYKDAFEKYTEISDAIDLSHFFQSTL